MRILANIKWLNNNNDDGDDDQDDQDNSSNPVDCSSERAKDKMNE